MLRGIYIHITPALICACAGAALASRMPRGSHGRAGALIGAVISAMPVYRGLSPADFLLSLSPSYSVPSLVLFAGMLCRGLCGTAVLPERDSRFLMGFGLLVSVPLFSTQLGLLPGDIYALGYGFSWAFAGLFALTVYFVHARSPLALVFLFCALVFDLGLYASNNLFDTLTDGVFFISALGWAAMRIIARARPGRHCATHTACD